MAEFQWWLLLVGLVAGGGLVAVVFLDGARREQDIDDEELPAEAAWIASRLGGGARRPLDPVDVEVILREHREYRLLAPPDRIVPVDAAPDGPTPSAAPAADAVPATPPVEAELASRPRRARPEPPG
jgi:hypothetical protein